MAWPSRAPTWSGRWSGASTPTGWRGAYYALASALGGTQTMALCSYDEAYTIPSEHAADLADGGVDLDRIDQGRHDVLITARGVTQLGEGLLHRLRIAFATDLLEAA